MSAPGKVLLAGGYVVLERPNMGLVLSTSARFHCAARLQRAGEDDAADAPAVVVHSPQYGSQFRYRVHGEAQRESDSEGPADVAVSVERMDGENCFVEHALEAALGVAVACSAPHAAELLAGRLRLCVALCADNGFYSQRATVRARGLPFTREALESLPPFLPCTVAAGGDAADGGSTDVPKTGMGSSATLVTSLVAAVLSALDAVALPGAEAGSAPLTGRAALHAVHRAAQAAHVRAQGKLEGARMHARDLVAGLLPGVAPRNDTVPAAWDHVARPLALPPGLALAMADASAGTNTRLAVKRVLQWRREGGDVAAAVWDALASCNGRIAAGLRRVTALARATSAEEARSLLAVTAVEEEGDEKGAGEGEVGSRLAAPAQATAWYTEAQARCAGLAGSEWERLDCPLAQELVSIRGKMREARSLLRDMGDAAGTEIEPPSQRALADETMAVPGVVFACVPGAGGYDALAALLVGDEARGKVEALWARWRSAESDRPGGEGEAEISALPVAESGHGILADDAETAASVWAAAGL